jgi:hypothetical protein
MKISTADLTSLSISVAIHIAVLLLVWVIILQTPKAEPELRLEVVLNSAPPALAEDSAAADSGRAAEAPPAAGDTAAAADDPGAAAETTPAQNPAAPSSQAPAAPAPRSPAPSRPATTQAAAAQTVPVNPTPVEQDYEVTGTTQNLTPTNLYNNLVNNQTDTAEPDVPEGFDTSQSRTTATNASADTPSDSSTEQAVSSADQAVLDELALLSQRMESDYQNPQANNSDSSSTAATSGVPLDSRFSSDLRSSGRQLVDPDRLNSLNLEQADLTWPAQLPVLLEVNQYGLVRILNVDQISTYNAELMLAIFEVFSGQVFNQDLGADLITGSVTIKFR